MTGKLGRWVEPALGSAGILALVFGLVYGGWYGFLLGVVGGLIVAGFLAYEFVMLAALIAATRRAHAQGRPLLRDYQWRP